MPKGKEKTQYEETKWSLGPASNITQMLKLLNQKFKITVISKLRACKKKIDNMP